MPRLTFIARSKHGCQRNGSGKLFPYPFPVFHFAAAACRLPAHCRCKRVNARLTTQPDFSSAVCAVSRSTLRNSWTIRTARSRSFTLEGFRSTIRLPTTLPDAHHGQGGEDVQNQLGGRAGLQARRTGQNLRAEVRGDRQGRPRVARGIFKYGLNVSSMVVAPRRFASPNAPHTNGVRPLAAIPTTTSRRLTPRNSIARAPASESSSAPSTDCQSADCPPAMMPWTISGGVRNVGGHSLASSTPSRPLVPAPT